MTGSMVSAEFQSVPSAKSVIEQDAAKAKGDDKALFKSVIDSPLVFPTAQDYAKLHTYRVLGKNDLKTYQGLFQPIVAG